jgi:hypothetical protein
VLENENKKNNKTKQNTKQKNPKPKPKANPKPKFKLEIKTSARGHSARPLSCKSHCRSQIAVQFSLWMSNRVCTLDSARARAAH